MRKIFTLFAATLFAAQAWADYDKAFPVSANVTLYFEYINDGTELKLIRPDGNEYNDIYKNIPAGQTDIVIPGDINNLPVTEIGDNVFFQSNITSVTIPNGVTNIGYSAFQYSKLKTANLGSTVKTIEYAAFSTSDLETITIPNSVTSIGDQAFYCCEKLTTVKLGNGIITIGDRAFDNPFNSKLVYNESGNAKYLGTNDNKYFALIKVIDKSAATVEINPTCKVIAQYAFEYCENLSGITIPSSVISIGSGAFIYCNNLSSVSIGSSVTTVGSNVFCQCNNLTLVTVPASVTSMGDCLCENTPSAVVLCEATVKPDGWEERWDKLSYDGPENERVTVVWNYKNIPVNTAVNDAARGSVTPSGTYEYGKTATLTATPKTGYKFVAWSDGNHDQERQVKVVPNLPTFTAYFYGNDQVTYTIVAIAKGKGTVSGDGVFLANEPVTLTATSYNANIYHFVKWSDGTTNATYTFNATEDKNLTAIFEGTSVNAGDTTTVHAIGKMIGENANAVFRPTLSGRYTIESAIEEWTSTYGSLIDEDGNVLIEKVGEYDLHGNFKFRYDLEAGKTYYIGAGFSDDSKEGDIPLAISQPEFFITVTTPGNGSAKGSGSYGYNEVATIKAIANEGYHLVRWNDNNTDTVRTITVTESKTYTATFEINEYSIAATGYTNGTVTGTGTYQHGATVTLSATPATGYHFNGWGDGNSDNPRTFEATEAKNMTPEFAINTYTVSVGVENGTVTGTGTYNHGQTATLTATANSGYEFAAWSDEVTTNPRQIVVTQNISLRAIIISEGEHVYNIKVAATENGTITGGGLYIVGRTATLEATPADGYHFAGWGDGNTDNPRQFVVSADMNLTPSFAINNYTVAVTTVGNGSVSGTGSFDYGQDVTLIATADNGYHFAGWNDGGTDNPRSFKATCDSSLTATFEINSYKVTGIAVNGTISGAHIYTHGSEATLTAYPEYGYHFTEWSDGEKSETRTFAVMSDTTFTALFEANTYTATVANAQHGTVSGAGEYTHGQTAIFTATAEAGYNFLFWGDGSTANPRSVKMTQDVEMRAVFALEGYSAFTVTVGTTGNGSVLGGGLYIEGDSATVTAKPESEAYHFVAWNDGSTENPRSFVVSSDTSFTATFEPNTFVVKAVSDNSEFGTVSGDGTYAFGATIVLKATPNEGYRFVRWSDDDIYNIKYLTADQNYDFTAYFAPVTDTVYIKTAISENAVKLKIYPNPTTSFVKVEADRNFSYTLSSMSGAVIRKDENEASYIVDLSGYPAGIYLLNTSDGKTHKIVKE